MASEVSICNQAISWLGGNLIIGFDDGTTESILCKANYALLRDAVLEEGKWTFATERFKLLPNPVAPVYGYSHKFEIPSTVFTVFHVTPHKENANDSEQFDFRRQRGFIEADAEVIYIKGIIGITDVSKFSKTFIQALAARIAADIAAPLTESTTKEAKMQAKYDKAISLALAVEGQQGKSDRIKTNSRIIRRR